MLQWEPTCDEIALGRSELNKAIRSAGLVFGFVWVFSAIINVLMLTGPLYMLNVYDRVLGSRSTETLIALSVLMIFCYAVMAVLDHARSQLLVRIGGRFQSMMDKRVFDASLRARASGRVAYEAAVSIQDLDALRRAIASPASASLFDLPFAPLFLIGIFVFDPLLGYLAISGGAVLVGLAAINRIRGKEPLANVYSASCHADNLAGTLQADAATIQALGMRQSITSRWEQLRFRALVSMVDADALSSVLMSASRAFRMALQSMMLGLGAYLVLQGKLSPGAMIAASVLMARALAPIESLVAYWPTLHRAKEGRSRLSRLLGVVQPVTQKTKLPKPRAHISAEQVTIIPPGDTRASLRIASFEVQPGQAVGVIGPSGAGKSTLAKSLVGLWRPASGALRFGGAELEQYDLDDLSNYVGYLPQTVTLLNGTIKENISRMATNSPDAEVIKAAKRAAAHDMILRLPGGYDTVIDPTDLQLSGGQVQRIGLARAMFGDPILLVLDEPNSNLDNEGSLAVNHAIRSVRDADGIVFVMAHRPAAIAECDLLIYIEEGIVKAFGPSDLIKAQVLHNRSQIEKAKGHGGSTA